MLKQKKVTRKSEQLFCKNKEKTDPVVKNEDIKIVETDGTEVEASLGTTISKNYNSLRIDCSVRFPTTKNKVRSAFEKAWELCGEELYEQLKEGRKLLDKL